jgi:hypothetical protein
LREENRLRAFQKRVMRKIFGPKRDEVRGECKLLHKEDNIKMDLQEAG